MLVNGQGRRIFRVPRVPRWYRLVEWGVRWGLLLIGSSERGGWGIVMDGFGLT